MKRTHAGGLVPTAILALMIVGVSAAQAGQGVLTTETGESVTLDVSETESAEPGANAVTAFGSTIECPGSTGTGHRYDTTPHEPVPNGSITFTGTGHANEPCAVSGGRQATVSTNGCDTVVHIGEEIEEGTFDGSGDLVCPEGKTLETTIYANSPGEGEGTKLCTLSVPPQKGFQGGHVVNEGGVLRVIGTAEGIHIERSGLCLFDGKGATTTSAQAHGDGTIRGTSEDKEIVAIAVSGSE